VSLAKGAHDGLDVGVGENDDEEDDRDEGAEHEGAAPAKSVGHGVMLLSGYGEPPS
jgi:hypothetical protein